MTHLFMNVRENPSYFLTDQNPIQEADAPEQLHVQKDPFLRTLLRAWGEQVTVRDTDQIIRSVRCISQMTRLKNRLKPNNA